MAAEGKIEVRPAGDPDGEVFELDVRDYDPRVHQRTDMAPAPPLSVAEVPWGEVPGVGEELAAALAKAAPTFADAAAADLEEVPGVGPVMARRLQEWLDREHRASMEAAYDELHATGPADAGGGQGDAPKVAQAKAGAASGAEDEGGEAPEEG